uniref:Ti plasmid pTi15955 T-DNA region n=1 Tax=Agrobacterium tumefaciens TaxID=358 RepID=Q44398_AGRTU|nr:unnamed protein product [Agrobacterium tumefaciens]
MGCACYTTLQITLKCMIIANVKCKMKGRILDIIRSIFSSTFLSVILFSCLNFTNSFFNVEKREGPLRNSCNLTVKIFNHLQWNTIYAFLEFGNKETTFL